MRIENNTTQDLGLLIKISIMLVISLFLLFVQASQAQQQIVDDAAVTTERSFQIESWYGEFESEFIPAIAVTPWLEFGVPLVFDTKDNFSFAGFALEAKAISRDFEEYGNAFGLVTGFGFNEDAGFSEFIAYVPYSMLTFSDSSVLHLNAGILSVDEGDSWETSFIYGARKDIGLHERFTLLTEIYAENDDFGYQAGGRIGLIPGQLEMDVMYGRGFQTGMQAPGITVGIAFTPDSIW